MYSISCHDGPRYNGIRLYSNHVYGRKQTPPVLYTRGVWGERCYRSWADLIPVWYLLHINVVFKGEATFLEIWKFRENDGRNWFCKRREYNEGRGWDQLLGLSCAVDQYWRYIYIYIFTIMKPSFAVAYITVWHTPSLRLTVSSQLVPRVAAVQSACNTDVAVIVWSDVSVVLLKV